MRKKAKTIITLFTVWMLTSCNLASNPDEVLTQYLHAIDKGNYREAYDYISAKDKAIKTADDYVKENSETPDLLLVEAFGDKRSFAIKAVTINTDTATIAVVRTRPDVRAILGSITSDTPSRGFSEKDFKKLSAQEIRAKLQGKEIPVMTTHETYTMLREAAGWKVFLDWKKQTAEKEKQGKINALLSEANQLKRINNLFGALDKYNQLLVLNSDLPQAKAEKAEVENEIKTLQEKQRYLKNIELQNIRIEQQKQSGSEMLKKSILGTIVNQGDRTLTKVKIAVYFLDQEGKVIKHPALATEYSFRDDNKPLKPMSRRDFSFAIEDYAPSLWAGGVTVKITDIEFDTAEPLGDKSAPMSDQHSEVKKPISVVTQPATKEPAAAAMVTVNAIEDSAPPAAVVPNEDAEHNAKYHVVKPNETLYSIAKRYGISANKICRLNNLKQNQSIKPGQKILVAQ